MKRKLLLGAGAAVIVLGVVAVGLWLWMTPSGPPTGDIQTNFKGWERYADHGDADAQFRVGMAYLLGRGVQRNDEMAVSWLQKAADQNVAQAQAQLGQLYHLGRGVPRHDSEAMRWLQKAACCSVAQYCWRFSEGICSSMVWSW